MGKIKDKTKREKNVEILGHDLPIEKSRKGINERNKNIRGSFERWGKLFRSFLVIFSLGIVKVWCVRRT